MPVHVVSAVTGEGLDGLSASFAPGQTAALLGSSGVGKSSLVNALAGAHLMATRAIREDDARGRHTTTHRQLVLLPNGRLMLDTPGMRELGLWDADAGVAATFADVEALAQRSAASATAPTRRSPAAPCRPRWPTAASTEAAGAATPSCSASSPISPARTIRASGRGQRKVWVQRARHYRAHKRQRLEDV